MSLCTALSLYIMAPKYFQSNYPTYSQSEPVTNKCPSFILLGALLVSLATTFDQVWVFNIFGLKMLSISFRCLSTLPGLLIVLMDVVMMLKLFPRSLIFLLSWPMMNRVRSKQEIVLQRLTRPWNRQKLVKHVNLFSIQFLAKFLLYNFKLTESTTQICQSTWLISTPTLDYW